MGVTTHGLPWPDGTAPVTDGDDAIRELAEALDPAHFKWVMGSLYRIDNTNWGVMNDGVHIPVGIDRITMNTTQVRVIYDEVVTQVHAVHATVDESFAAAGLRVGASVGTSYTALQFYLGSSTTPVNPGALTTAGANVWFAGWFSV
jgi:hypothetical protein